MLKRFLNNKGVALIIALGLLLMVTILANVIVQVIWSQSRLTHHQVSRMQAYYASLAGINHGILEVRAGNWTTATCGDGTSINPCLVNFTCSNSPTNSDFWPSSIINNQTAVVVTNIGSALCPSLPAHLTTANTVCISAATNYTYNTSQF